MAEATEALAHITIQPENECERSSTADLLQADRQAADVLTQSQRETEHSSTERIDESSLLGTRCMMIMLQRNSRTIVIHGFEFYGVVLSLKATP